MCEGVGKVRKGREGTKKGAVKGDQRSRRIEWKGGTSRKQRGVLNNVCMCQGERPNKKPEHGDEHKH